MNTQITSIANNYAVGIIEYAGTDILKLQKILADLRDIQNVLTQSQDFNEVLKNPAIDFSKKIEIIESIFGANIDQQAKNLLKILIEKQRFNEFNNIVAVLKNKIEDIKNEKEVLITSAVTLDNEQKNLIISKLEKRLHKKVIPIWIEDKKIISGIIVQIDDNVIDISLLNKIKSLSKNIIK